MLVGVTLVEEIVPPIFEEESVFLYFYVLVGKVGETVFSLLSNPISHLLILCPQGFMGLVYVNKTTCRNVFFFKCGHSIF